MISSKNESFRPLQYTFFSHPITEKSDSTVIVLEKTNARPPRKLESASNRPFAVAKPLSKKNPVPPSWVDSLLEHRLALVSNCEGLGCPVRSASWMTLDQCAATRPALYRLSKPLTSTGQSSTSIVETMERSSASSASSRSSRRTAMRQISSKCAAKCLEVERSILRTCSASR